MRPRRCPVTVRGKAHGTMSVTIGVRGQRRDRQQREANVLWARVGTRVGRIRPPVGAAIADK